MRGSTTVTGMENRPPAGWIEPAGKDLSRLLELQAATAPAASRLGLDVYLVGGAVRDLVEGRPLSGEWDLVVIDRSGSGARCLAGELASVWGWREPVPFERFGTYLVSGPAGPVEVSQGGLRSRLPPPSNDPLIADALTRDFTLNALYVKLDGGVTPAEGPAVLDPCGRGVRDLRAGLLRSPGPADAIIRDDPARILRGARFCATHGYTLSPSLSRAARGLAGLLSRVAVERIRDEMHKLLMAEAPSAGLRRLAGWGVLEVLMPEVQAMVGFRQRTPHHYPDLFRHTLRVVDRSPPDLPVRWAALLHDCGKPGTRTEDGKVDRYIGHESLGAELASGLLTRMKVAKATAGVVIDLIRLHMVHYSSEWSDRAVRRFIARSGENLPMLLELLEADARSLRIRADKLRALARLRDRVEVIKETMAPVRSPLGGERIMELLGIGPGPGVGRAKDILAGALTDGVISGDPEEAERFLVREWKGLGGRRS